MSLFRALVYLCVAAALVVAILVSLPSGLGRGTPWFAGDGDLVQVTP